MAGVVVKEPGSQPLKKVLVQVVAENQKEAGNYTASSDADGQFHIENVAPGRYQVFLEKTGFVAVDERGTKSDSQVFTIQSGQPLEGLMFRMSPTAVISGRITDEDGDPMAGVRVLALRKLPGKAKREGAGTESTNDLGEYRLSGLAAGQYWVAAMPPPDFRDYEHERSTNNADHADTAPDVRYLTTYYPGTYDEAQASLIALKAGDDIPVNLTLTPAKTYHVRGVVTGIAALQKPVVELFSKAGDSAHAAEVGPDGQFEVRGVGPGSYILRVSSASDSEPVIARQEISVVSSDVEGLKLAPQPSFTISGHLHIEGTPQGLSQYSVNLRATGLPEETGFFMLQEFFGANAPVDRMGNFAWKNINPGNYVVQPFGSDEQSNSFLKSVTLGGRDVESGFNVSGPATVDLVISFNGATVDGTVFEKEKSVEGSHPVANATVVAVPPENYRNLLDHFGVGETDQRGHFTIHGLGPGTYTLYAWKDVEQNLYHDPDFLKSQEANGTALKVEEGSRQVVDLKLSSAGEEWR